MADSRQQLERQMALRAFLMSVPEPPMSEEASGLVIAYVGKLSIDWVKVAKEVVMVIRDDARL